MWAVVLTAIVLRVVALAAIPDRLVADVDMYRGIADNLLAGHGYSLPGSTAPTAYRPPLYPLLLAAALSTGAERWAIGTLHVLLGAVTVWCTMRAARQAGLRHGVLVAGLLVACDPLLLHLSTQIMTETLAAGLSALLLCLYPFGDGSHGAGEPVRAGSPGAIGATHLVETGATNGAGSVSDGPSMSIWPCVAWGAVAGAAVLCRPTFAATLGAWLLFEMWRAVRSRTASTRDWTGIRQVLIAGVAAFVVLAPWGLRNVWQLNALVLTTTHGGYTLLLPHNPVHSERVLRQPWGTVWDGDSLRAWQTSLEQRMQRSQPPFKTEAARDAWFRDEAVAHIRRHPDEALWSAVSLQSRFWSLAPSGDSALRRHLLLRVSMAIFYGAEFLLAAMGLWRGVRSRPAWWRAAMGLVLTCAVVHTLYWADMRMRAPVQPALALLAAAAFYAGRDARPPTEWRICGLKGRFARPRP